MKKLFIVFFSFIAFSGLQAMKVGPEGNLDRIRKLIEQTERRMQAIASPRTAVESEELARLTQYLTTLRQQEDEVEEESPVVIPIGITLPSAQEVAAAFRSSPNQLKAEISKFQTILEGQRTNRTMNPTAIRELRRKLEIYQNAQRELVS